MLKSPYTFKVFHVPSRTKLIFLISLTILMLNACASRKSVISLNEIDTKKIQKTNEAPITRLDIDMSAVNKNEKTRFVDQNQALIYDFTFLIHKDIRDTLPLALNEGIVLRESSGPAKAHEAEVKIDVDTDLFIYTGFSAAPRYELSISLPSEVFLDQTECGVISVSMRDEVVVGAFSNTQEKRDKIMTSRYKDMLTQLYQQYLESLVETLKECRM